MNNSLLCPNRKIALELFEALQNLYDEIPPRFCNSRNNLLEQLEESKKLLLRASQYFAKQEREAAEAIEPELEIGKDATATFTGKIIDMDAKHVVFWITTDVMDSVRVKVRRANVHAKGGSR